MNVLRIVDFPDLHERYGSEVSSFPSWVPTADIKNALSGAEDEQLDLGSVDVRSLVFVTPRGEQKRDVPVPRALPRELRINRRVASRGLGVAVVGT